MKNLPKSIWLNFGTNGTGEDANFRELSEVTWSEEQIFSDDVQYFRKSQWISVDDKYPKHEPSVPDNKKTRYLVRVEIGSIMPTVGYCVAYVASKSRFNVDMDWNKVTHWMPIPELPKSCKQ